MTTPAKPDPASTFELLWMEAISNVLGQIASAPFPFEAADAPPETAALSANDLHVTITAGGGVRGEMCLRIPQASVLELVRLFIGDSQAGARDLTADDRSAVEELMRQIAGQVSTAAKPHWGEMPLTVTLSEAPTWSAAASGWVASSLSAPRQLGLEWRFSAALHSALLAAWQDPALEASIAAQAAPGSGSNLGFFMDVELEVTLRFGGKSIQLKEILDLGPGSVLELDREVQDPADLLLDGKLIARGDIVMVNGNYGLRVTEVFTSSSFAA